MLWPAFPHDRCIRGRRGCLREAKEAPAEQAARPGAVGKERRVQDVDCGCGRDEESELVMVAEELPVLLAGQTTFAAPSCL